MRPWDVRDIRDFFRAASWLQSCCSGTYPAASTTGRQFDPSCSSRTTFRPILLLQSTRLLLRDNISTYPDAPGRHFDLFRAPGRHFDVSIFSRATCLPAELRQDVSTYPVTLGRHFDISCCSVTTFRPILWLWDNISTYPAALGTFRPSCSSRTTSCRSETTFRPILLLRDEHTSRISF